jgi:hypothetical protein
MPNSNVISALIKMTGKKPRASAGGYQAYRGHTCIGNELRY